MRKCGQASSFGGHAFISIKAFGGLQVNLHRKCLYLPKKFTVESSSAHSSFLGCGGVAAQSVANESHRVKMQCMPQLDPIHFAILTLRCRAWAALGVIGMKLTKELSEFVGEVAVSSPEYDGMGVGGLLLL